MIVAYKHTSGDPKIMISDSLARVEAKSFCQNGTATELDRLPDWKTEELDPDTLAIVSKSGLRTKKTNSEIFYEIDAMSSGDRERLFCVILANAIQNNPSLVNGYSGFSGFTGSNVLYGDKPA